MTVVVRDDASVVTVGPNVKVLRRGHPSMASAEHTEAALAWCRARPWLGEVKRVMFGTWRDFAPCTSDPTVSGEDFIAPLDASPAWRPPDHAIALCQTCPVAVECERSAGTDEPGVWGGHSRAARKRRVTADVFWWLHVARPRVHRLELLTSWERAEMQEAS